MSASDGQGEGGTMLGTGPGDMRAAVGSTAPPNGDPLLGKALAGRYHIERKLGEGGMGAVYVGRHMTLDKVVAIKVLHPEYARKPDLVERFLQEAKAASKIRHENVIDITDFGITEEGMVFFCMEHLSGQDLHELVTRAKLEGQRVPWQRTAPIFLQICGALAAAHEAGVIHRDLKPENIFLIEWLGNPDFVKLLDFGIAKMTEVNEEGRKLTKTGMLFGTPEYMSPEQARGEAPDHRVDVYAMGCILFQLVTGDVPFAGESFMAVLAQHLTAEPPVVEAAALAALGAPAALGPVISRALVKDRDQRFGSITELADAVRAACGGDVVSHEVEASRTRSGWRGSAVIPVTPAETLSVPAAKPPSRRGLIGLGAAVGVIAVAGIVFAATRGGGSESSESDGQVGESSAEGETTATPGEGTALEPETASGGGNLEAGGEPPTDTLPRDAVPADGPPDGKAIDGKSETVPVDKKPETTPADKKPETMPADKKPADKKPSDKKPSDKKPSDKKPSDKKPGDLEPGNPKLKTPFGDKPPAPPS